MKTRTIKELLQVMLDNKDLFETGLCKLSLKLYSHNLINYNEDSKLLLYIYNNRPPKYSSLKAFISRNRGYYWPKNDIKPRIEWIKYHIKKNN